MATKVYDEYEVDQLAKAKRQSDAYSADRKAQADSAVKTSDAVYDAANVQAQKDYAASVKDTEQSYRTVYDANVVDELVARRNAAEAIANSNMANSGLNNTQQTAISLMRGRADSNTTRQKQAAVDAIMRELDSVIAQNNAQKTAAAQDIYAQADADILSFKNNADTAARQNAAALYTADQEAETARIAAEQEAAAAQYAAEQEAAVKQAQMLLDAQKAQSQERMDMLKLGYQYDEGLGGYVKMSESNLELTIEKQNLIIEYMKQGVSYDDATAYVNDAFGSNTQSSGADVNSSEGTAVSSQSQKNTVRNSILTPGEARYSGEVGSHAMHMTYEHYVNSLLQSAIAEGKITAEEAAEIAIEIETQHGVDLNPNK